ncbi:unnamed protein product [marine sediment metagenome]|uniref:Uncharacterized protein n=1 Tax=marine sediment metagenome TaxID=412755 RepID=X0REB3_9ZZZZ
MNNCHPKQLEAQPMDTGVSMCKECGDIIVDVDEQRKVIVALHEYLDKIPNFIKGIFIG